MAEEAVGWFGRAVTFLVWRLRGVRRLGTSWIGPVISIVLVIAGAVVFLALVTSAWAPHWWYAGFLLSLAGVYLGATRFSGLTVAAATVVGVVLGFLALGHIGVETLRTQRAAEVRGTATVLLAQIDDGPAPTLLIPAASPLSKAKAAVTVLCEEAGGAVVGSGPSSICTLAATPEKAAQAVADEQKAAHRLADDRRADAKSSSLTPGQLIALRVRLRRDEAALARAQAAKRDEPGQAVAAATADTGSAQLLAHDEASAELAVARYRLTVASSGEKSAAQSEVAKREAALASTVGPPAWTSVATAVSTGADAVISALPRSPDVPLALEVAGWAVVAALGLALIRVLSLRNATYALGPVSVSPPKGDDKVTLGEVERFRTYLLRNLPEPGAVPGGQAVTAMTDIAGAVASADPTRGVAAVLKAVVAAINVPSGYTVEYRDLLAPASVEGDGKGPATPADARGRRSTPANEPAARPADEDDESEAAPATAMHVAQPAGMATAGPGGTGPDGGSPVAGASSPAASPIAVRIRSVGSNRVLGQKVFSKGTRGEMLRSGAYWAAASVLESSRSVPPWARWDAATSETLARYYAPVDEGADSGGAQTPTPNVNASVGWGRSTVTGQTTFVDGVPVQQEVTVDEVTAFLADGPAPVGTPAVGGEEDPDEALAPVGNPALHMLHSALDQAPTSGLLALELSQAEALAGDQLRSFEHALRAATLYPRYLNARYRLAVSASLLAGADAPAALEKAGPGYRARLTDAVALYGETTGHNFAAVDRLSKWLGAPDGRDADLAAALWQLGRAELDDCRRLVWFPRVVGNALRCDERRFWWLYLAGRPRRDRRWIAWSSWLVAQAHDPTPLGWGRHALNWFVRATHPGAPTAAVPDPAVAAGSRAPAQQVDVLRRAGVFAREQRYARAVFQLQQDWQVAYNLACMWSVSLQYLSPGDKQQRAEYAMQLLEVSVLSRNSFQLTRDWVIADPDLTPLQDFLEEEGDVRRFAEVLNIIPSVADRSEE